MAAYGLLINYEYCTGCSACVISCKEEHGYPVGQWGINIYEDGPWPLGDGNYNWNKVPVPTDLCDLCAERTAKGKEPICVHHCLGDVMRYGTVEELAKLLENKGKQVLFVPQYKPLDAKGKFVPKGKKAREKRAVKVDIRDNEDFEIAIHRNKDIGFIDE